MPLYEYQCQKCGLRFERRQGFNEAPVSECPECNGQVQRLIQPVGIIFKGSGFYVTDNRAKSSTRIPTKDEKDKKDENADEQADLMLEQALTVLAEMSTLADGGTAALPADQTSATTPVKVGTVDEARTGE